MKEFQENLNYVFTKKKFIKSMGKKAYMKSKAWVDKSNGQQVEVENSWHGFVFKNRIAFGVQVCWCKCIGKKKLSTN